VFTESERDYRPGIISSQFNFIHVIVKPVRGGKFFRVRVMKKEQVGFVAPILNKMVVSANVLPSLIRFTLLNAHKECLTLPQLKA